MRLFVVILLAIASGAAAGLWYHRAAAPELKPEAAAALVVPHDAPPAGRPSAPKVSLWGKIESEDLRQYIANLRDFGCPDQTIRYIITGVVYRSYQAKVNQIFNPLSHYWLSPDSAFIDKQIQAIRAERDQVLASLDMLSDEINVNGWTAAQEQRIAEAVARFPNNPPSPHAPASDWSSFLQNRRSRIDYLAQFMTPDELYNYRINQDGNSRGIRSLLNLFNASDAEFKSVFTALDGENLSMTNGFLRSDLEDKLKVALGDDRYAAYHQQLTTENIVLSGFSQSFNLTSDQLQQLQAIRNTYGSSLESKMNPDYQQAVQKLFQNGNAARSYFENPHLYRSSR